MHVLPLYLIMINISVIMAKYFETMTVILITLMISCGITVLFSIFINYVIPEISSLSKNRKQELYFDEKMAFYFYYMNQEECDIIFNKAYNSCAKKHGYYILNRYKFAREIKNNKNILEDFRKEVLIYTYSEMFNQFRRNLIHPILTLYKIGKSSHLNSFITFLYTSLYSS